MITKTELINLMSKAGIKPLIDDGNFVSFMVSEDRRFTFTHSDDVWLLMCKSICLMFDDISLDVKAGKLTLTNKNSCIGAVYFNEL